MDYQDTWEIKEMDLSTEIVFESIRIMFDIDRNKYEKKCEALAKNWKKWWRPKKETKQNQTKPNGFSEKQTKAKKPKEEEIEEVNEYEEVNKKVLEIKIESLPLWTARNKFYSFLLEHIKYISEKIEIEKIDNKLWEFQRNLWDERARLELESFCEHHRNEKTLFKSTIWRLNTWLSNKLWN